MNRDRAPRGGRRESRQERQFRSENPQDDRPVRHARGAGHGRPWLKIIGGTAVLVLAATGGGGYFVYSRLNANIASSALYSGTTGDAGVQKADAQGRYPVNVLVIGTDSRSSEENCKLGGACGDTGSNADVELLVHLSADRSNITAMSIPRDTITDLPGCENAETGQSVAERTGQINGALAYGPGCSVAAVHQLTGVTIDHFVMVDFSGVIAMSDATGGVQVCVSADVYDTYSHLKLSKGKHTLKGEGALQFVRTRHGFGDGSDLGRTYGQHAFLSGAIQSIKDKGTLLNPTKLYGVADAATKALTVDDGLNSISKLADLATEMNKVDTDRITFTTMQTAADPDNANRVIPAEAAEKLFATIAADQSLTDGDGDDTSTATATSSAAATTAAVDATSTESVSRAFAVQVSNRSAVDGRATQMTTALQDLGYTKAVTDSSSGSTQASTQILYKGKAQLEKAQQLAADLNVPSSLIDSSTEVDGVTLVLGKDWTTGDTYPKTTKKSRKAALADSHASNAKKSSCVPVSTYNTVTYKGVSMTPTEAYAAATTVKDSDD
ncbi:LCP family protein [Kineosporia sp. J2-2]|uniref:LCP family protein n=1 Tax=Kineosporia corallincola TaxID=2835133 RepID=A0ABS5TRE3_9ACTN|nr:LCP family protein [Kineosporia corallincola]MBT0773370.1 LCP family protein [Kineosporia corallincola]